MTNESKNAHLLADFMAYCQAHPGERFWQALRNWAGVSNIVAQDFHYENGKEYIRSVDTFFWEGRTEPLDDVETG